MRRSKSSVPAAVALLVLLLTMGCSAQQQTKLKAGELHMRSLDQALSPDVRIELSTQAIELSGKEAEPYLWRAETYYSLGNQFKTNGDDTKAAQYFDNAIDDYQRAISFATSQQWASSVRLHLAWLYAYLGRYDQSEQAVRESMSNTLSAVEIEYANLLLEHIKEVRIQEESMAPPPAPPPIPPIAE